MASCTKGHANTFAEGKKKEKHLQTCSAAGVDFIPLSVEHFGSWGEPAILFFRKLATSIAHRSNMKPAEVLSPIYQNLSSILAKHNAKAVVRRLDK